MAGLEQVVALHIKSLTRETCDKIKEILPSETRHKLTEKIIDVESASATMGERDALSITAKTDKGLLDEKSLTIANTSLEPSD